MDAFDNGNSSQASSGSSGSKRPSPTIQATNSKKNKHSDQLGNETDAAIEAKRVKGGCSMISRYTLKHIKRYMYKGFGDK